MNQPADKVAQKPWTINTYFQRFKTDAQRFLEKIDKNGPIQPHVPHLGPCWKWLGAVTDCGYGTAYYQKKLQPAHRVAYIYFVGPIVDDLHCLHKCDYKRCVNPHHLFLGTRTDNMRDMVQKGRNAYKTGNEHHTRIHPELVLRGEANSYSKLTDSIIREIRLDYPASRMTMAQFGLKYGIGASHVCQIVNKKLWAHVK